MKRISIGTLATGATAMLLVSGLTTVRGGPIETLVRTAPHSTLPAPADAQGLLNSTHRHREWITVPVSAHRSALAWVMYPERADRAPVVILSNSAFSADVWTRAISDQLSAEGFVVAVPDVMTEVDAEGNRYSAVASSASNRTEMERRIESVRAAVVALPSAQNRVTHIRLDQPARRIDVHADGRHKTFDLTANAWPSLIEYLNGRTGNSPSAVSAAAHADHLAMQPAQAASPPPISSLAIKDPRLPAGPYTARATLQNTKLKNEWVDIPLEGSNVKLHTFVVYPARTDPAGVVVVMPHGTGLDHWHYALAVQVAEDGFIAVAPDIWSGIGPNGGNTDSFEFPDDAMRAAAGKITPDVMMKRYRAARAWAIKLPQANGKSGSIGFCAGGSASFRLAALEPEHNASVVFYGGPPSEQEMANIRAPVLGLYGENDVRVVSTVEPTRQAMARLGKQYEARIYPKATHSFVMQQQIGSNPAAIADAWPRAIAFLRAHLE